MAFGTIAISGYLDAKISAIPGTWQFWVQVGDDPEARRLLDGSDLVYEGDKLALPEDVKQWVRNCIAYQRGLMTYAVEAP